MISTDEAIALGTKAALALRRVGLIDRIRELGAGPEQAVERMQLQTELSDTNKQIKQINIAESQRNKKSADVRKTLGKIQHDVDLERHDQRPDGKANRQPELGEMIVIRAKQLLKLVDSVPLKHWLPHTEQFVPHLQAFVAAQKDMLKREQAGVAPSSAIEEWQKTWTSDGETP